jgi:cytochrome P450
MAKYNNNTDALTSTAVLRPAKSAIKGWMIQIALSAAPFMFGLLRRFKPILKLGNTVITSRYDDVIEVFNADAAFMVPYQPKLDRVTQDQPFILGLSDGVAYRSALGALRKVVVSSDLPLLAQQVEAKAEAIVAASDGRLEVVGDLVRPLAFEVLAGYFGVPDPKEGQLDVWATRLFEFVFMGATSDRELVAQVDGIAPAFRDHVAREIARRKTGGKTGAKIERTGQDDVMTRCLMRQAAGEQGYTDDEISTNIMCMVIGGPPQWPMVVPQALEHLLRRPDALHAAVRAAQADDDDLLWQIVQEAIRFDPLAPGLPRVATEDWVIAEGTKRACLVPKGANVIVSFASAMMDERRVPNPHSFDPTRAEEQYITFGHGLHECFGLYINRACLHLILKPLLKRPGLRRAAGPKGRLRKAGLFAQSLSVRFS